jgi:hypothetical protein
VQEHRLAQTLLQLCRKNTTWTQREQLVTSLHGTSCAQSGQVCHAALMAHHMCWPIMKRALMLIGAAACGISDRNGEARTARILMLLPEPTGCEVPRDDRWASLSSIGSSSTSSCIVKLRLTAGFSLKRRNVAHVNRQHTLRCQWHRTRRIANDGITPAVAIMPTSRSTLKTVVLLPRWYVRFAMRERLLQISPCSWDGSPSLCHRTQIRV